MHAENNDPVRVDLVVHPFVPKCPFRAVPPVTGQFAKMAAHHWLYSKIEMGLLAVPTGWPRIFRTCNSSA